MAKSLRAWRTERLLSTRRLAELAGSSNKTIVQLENGRQIATFATIEKLSRALDVEPREVFEFARALDVRAGVAEPLASAEARRMPHVYCVCAAGLLQPLAGRLLETGQYGVTTVAGVPVTPRQVASARPDVVVLDLAAGSTLDLLHGLRSHAATQSVPIVVTSAERAALDARAVALEETGVSSLTIVPFERDLRELMSAVESLASPG